MPEPEPDLRRVLVRTLAGLALVFCLVPWYVAAPLLDPDEGLHGAIAQEMVLRHDYVTPTFLGEPFLDKPILFFWAEALSLRAVGMNEAGVRLPPLLFGVLGMLAVAWLGRALYGSGPGLLAGIVYGTMMLPLALSQIAVHDVAIVPFMCAAVVCLWRAAHTRYPWSWTFGAGLALGLSILTKGLVGVVFAGVFVACAGLLRRQLIVRLWFASVVAVLVAAVVAAPWYLLMERAHPGYLHYYFIDRHLRGFLTATQRHAGRPWWYYVPVVIGGALPWTLYLPGAVRDGFRQWRANVARAPRAPIRAAGAEAPGRLVAVSPPPIAILWLWFAIGFVLLSIGQSKLATYAVPVFPALAILIAVYWDRVLTARGRDEGGQAEGQGTAYRPRMDGWFIFAHAIHAFMMVLLPLIALLVARWRYHVHYGPAAWAGLVAGLLASLWLRGRAAGGGRAAYVWLLGGLTAIAFAILIAVVLPPVSRGVSARDLAGVFNSQGSLPSSVFIVEDRIGSLVFYLTAPLRAQASPSRLLRGTMAEGIGRARVAPADAVLVVREPERVRFEHLFAVPPAPTTQAGTFLLYRADRIREALARQR